MIILSFSTCSLTSAMCTYFFEEPVTFAFLFADMVLIDRGSEQGELFFKIRNGGGGNEFKQGETKTFLVSSLYTLFALFKRKSKIGREMR